MALYIRYKKRLYVNVNLGEDYLDHSSRNLVPNGYIEIFERGQSLKSLT
jgi:hypothetical protein